MAAPIYSDEQLHFLSSHRWAILATSRRDGSPQQGTAEGIESDPERAELSADVLAVVRGPERPEPAAIIGWLDDNQRTVLRVTPRR